ncbi:DUF887-domain-containing protein [Gymnopus androsaceus JB14]|uniref:DUF887-domain-containing protein n=1 Tax=Gymnopus androsaceus JB14 TaxID=1447944 RepID=A0A6A4H8T7_9AGAR|nr:DUF887-domain-containing protein [Gymnopus androsaceus JB14]
MKQLSDLSLSLGLTRFPENLHTFLSSLFFFLVIHQAFAPAISNSLSSNFRAMNRRGRNNWSIHIVSQIHALIIVPMALRALSSPNLDKDRAFGWDEETSGPLQAIASAYFVWDTIDAAINYHELGFIIHGAPHLCFRLAPMIYIMSFSPFLSYYAARCLLWETSTIFLNIHWFLDKTNRTGTTFQLVNGIFLLATFFGVRLVYGGYVSYNFFFTLYEVRDTVPMVYLLVYGVGNIVLQALNVFWFTKMIAALRKRFAVDRKSVKANGKLDAKKE